LKPRIGIDGYAPILIKAPAALNGLKALLYSDITPKLGVLLMLEIKFEAVPDSKRILPEFQEPRSNKGE